MKEYWNKRFEEDYLYGEAPNSFFKEELDKLSLGKVLLPAEGQGRNALYAASEGWNVEAFDNSKTAREKALTEAKRLGLRINYSLQGYDNFDFPEESFDVIALVFSHLPAGEMRRVHKKYLSLLKPGGVILGELFSKEQLAYSSGGPPIKEMLVSIEELMEDFGQHEIEHLEQSIVELNEGKVHKGETSVVRFLVRKK